MGIATYDDLVSFVSDHLQLDTDTIAQLPNLIRLGEVRLNRLLTTPEREKVSTQDTVAAQQTLTLPSDFRQLRSIWINDDYPLAQVTPNVLFGQFTKDSASGEPQVFTIMDGSFYFGPIPDAAYTISIAYVADIPALTSTATSNWLTDTNPDAYIYATMAEAEAYRGNLDAAQRWLGMLDSVIAEINVQGNRYRMTQPIRLRSQVVV